MAKKVYVHTGDSFLFQKIYLSLLSEGIVAVRTDGTEPAAELLLIDVDTTEQRKDGAILMSRFEGSDLSIPFTPELLLKAVSGEKRSTALLTLGEKCAYLRDREIRLTDVEYSLLSLLIKRGGFVPREELLHSVWGEAADGGVLNVYVHYLREKLECLGEKIIIASRGQGYKVDEKYLVGGDGNA